MRRYVSQFLLVFVGVLLSACSLVDEHKIVLPDGSETEFLEHAEGKVALEWSAARGESAQQSLSSYSKYSELKQQVESVLYDQRKTPFGRIVDGYVYNYWTDKEHPQGIWRRTTLAEYKTAYPKWEMLMDFDALSKKMGQKIVPRGFVRCKQKKNLVLVHMSFGGRDEVVFQEWDFNTKDFVPNGLASKNAKGEWICVKLSGAGWVDADTVVLETYQDKSELSSSGYPTGVYLWKRGEPIAKAKRIYHAPKDHMMVGSGVILDHEKSPVIFISDRKSFYNSDAYLWTAVEGLRPIKMPSNSHFLYWFKGQVFFSLNSDLEIGAKKLLAGSVIAMNWEDMLKPHDQKSSLKVIFSPTDREVFYSLNVTKNEVLLQTSYNVSSKLYRMTFEHGEWSSLSEVKLPHQYTSVGIVSDKDDDKALFFIENSIVPPSVYLWNQSQTLSVLRKPLYEFDSVAFEMHQYEAESADGTKIPYFVVQKKGIQLDGKNPTLLRAYGGFQMIQKPHFSRMENEVWVKNGGVSVLANIRGGGEFGPEWHKAALKENRQRSFDDFIAVAEDLIKRGITSPQHLGIEGGSNGGLLVSVAMTQRPELFGAVVCEVPILDMLRYTEFGAGESWIAEYGDPRDCRMRLAIRQYAPLEHLYTNRSYPPVLITGSAIDQRTHPWHSRIFKYMLEKHPSAVSYYLESADSGHGGGASLKDWVDLHTNILAFYYRYLTPQK